MRRLKIIGGATSAEPGDRPELVAVRRARPLPPPVADDLREVAALDELHREVGDAPLAAGGEDRHDVVVVQPGDDLGLRLEPLELAALLEESGPAALVRLMEQLPDTLGASWALVVDVSAMSAGPPEILAASLGAPSAARLPAAWLDFSLLDALGGGREVARQVAAHHRGDVLEVAAALLDRPSAAVVLGRQRGPRFRASELRHLGLLARIAASVSVRSGTLIEAI